MAPPHILTHSDSTPWGFVAFAHEMEDACMRYIAWKNNQGRTPEEVAQRCA